MKSASRILALSLVAAMLFSFAGCKKSDSSSELSVEYVYQYEEAEETASGEKTESGKGDKNSSKGTTSTSSRVPSASKQVKEAYEAKAKKYRGTKVVFATWQSATEYGASTIKAFEKKYGIKVEIDLIGQGNYINDVASRIASKQAPDVCKCIQTFPAGIQCLQPIDAAELDLRDPIWDTNVLSRSKINGKSYLTNAIGSLFNGVNCLYYDKKIFKEIGIPTPEDYVKAGNWNLETFEKTMKAIKSYNEDYKGAYVDINALFAAMNCQPWKWSNGKMSSGLNSRLTNICNRVSKWYDDGLITQPANQNETTYFKQGSCGMAITHSFGLKTTGFWRDRSANDIGFTSIPDYNKSTKALPAGFWSAFGICKGAKNPAGAGVFLRYYLDVNNWDTNGQFISSAAEDYFYKLSTSKANASKTSYYFSGNDGVAGAKTFSSIVSAVRGKPAQVTSSLEALKNTVNLDVKNINAMLKKVK